MFIDKIFHSSVTKSKLLRKSIVIQTVQNTVQKKQVISVQYVVRIYCIRKVHFSTKGINRIGKKYSQAIKCLN